MGIQMTTTPLWIWVVINMVKYLWVCTRMGNWALLKWVILCPSICKWWFFSFQDSWTYTGSIMWTLWQCTQNPTVLHLRDSSYRWIAMQNRPETSRNGQSMPKDSLCNNKVKLNYIAQRRITPEITRIISSTSLRHILYMYIYI